MICHSTLILTFATVDLDRTDGFLSVRLWTSSEASRNVPGKVPNLTFHRDCKFKHVNSSGVVHPEGVHILPAITLVWKVVSFFPADYDDLSFNTNVPYLCDFRLRPN